MPVLLIQGIDRNKVLPGHTECSGNSCRIGFAKNEDSIPETEVGYINVEIL